MAIDAEGNVLLVQWDPGPCTGQQIPASKDSSGLGGTRKVGVDLAFETLKQLRD